jgi:hypothetical protein
MLEEEEKKLSNDPSSEWHKSRVDYFKDRVRGTIYRGRSKSEYIADKKSLIRVTYARYLCHYIGHYDKEKYKEQMMKYHEGKLKSRPNGRKWCEIPASISECRVIDHPDGRYKEFVKPDPQTKSSARRKRLEKLFW